MIPRCRPGQRAWIIGARTPAGQRNIGKMVLVLERTTEGEHYGASWGDRDGALSTAICWFIESLSGPLITSSNGGDVVLRNIVSAYDGHLEPIPDDLLDAEIGVLADVGVTPAR